MVAETQSKISTLGDVQNSTEHGLKQEDLRWLCPKMRIRPEASSGPFQAKLFCDSLLALQASGLPSHLLL